jgi:AAA domain/UvrD-like helicase C-terminal domain
MPVSAIDMDGNIHDVHGKEKSDLAALGPFRCPGCRGPMFLRGGKYSSAISLHFAHLGCRVVDPTVCVSCVDDNADTLGVATKKFKITHTTHPTCWHGDQLIEPHSTNASNNDSVMDCIVDSLDLKGEVIKVTAIAGAGKTTLLYKCMTIAAQRGRVLVLMFNRAPRDEFADKIRQLGLSNSVHVKTTCAFSGGGKRSSDDNDDDDNGNESDEENPSYSTTCLGTPKTIKSGKCNKCTQSVLDSLNNYMWSSDRAVLPIHCILPTCNRVVESSIIPLVETLWERNLHRDKPKTFAMANKIMQLDDRLYVDKISQYDYIFIDEAQDSTPCEMSMYSKRRDNKLIMIVGDPYQCINQFRGASQSAFHKPLYNKHFRLPCTYRYGYPMNKIVQTMVQSWNPSANIFSRLVFESAASVPTTNTVQVLDIQHATKLHLHLQETSDVRDVYCLFRSNASILKAFMLFVERDDIFMTTTSETCDIVNNPFITQLLHLYMDRGGAISNDWTYKQLKLCAKQTDGYEKFKQNHCDILVRRVQCEIVELFKDELLNMQTRIECKKTQIITDDSIKLRLHLGTVHKSKGATYEHVFLGDDFIHNPSLASLQEERNILYVALTRAQKSCMIALDTWENIFPE